MVGTFAIVFAVASAVVLTDVAKTADAVLPVLLLQLFAASSGFAGPARRGYYDMLLTRGDRRLWIAVVHWLMSVAPGAATLLALAGMEAVARRAFPELALAGGTVAAMAVVSLLSWSLTVALPRFSGAIGWLVTLMLLTSFWSPAQTLAHAPVSSPVAAAAVLVHPGLLIGRELPAAQALLVAPGLGLGATAFIIACLWITRTDFPLEAAQ